MYALDKATTPFVSVGVAVTTTIWLLQQCNEIFVQLTKSIFDCVNALILYCAAGKGGAKRQPKFEDILRLRMRQLISTFGINIAHNKICCIKSVFLVVFFLAGNTTTIRFMSCCSANA